MWHVQRRYWIGSPDRLPGGLGIQKAKGDGMLVAECEWWSHECSWESRLTIDGSRKADYVCRSIGSEMLKTIDN
jgi:hypothetical protein